MAVVMTQPCGSAAGCRWHMAMAEVAASLQVGCVMQRWQVDAYADEPYCDNFRGVCARPLCSTSQAGHDPARAFSV